MPLALTIVETFKRARQPIQVLRYDGTNRRGESHIDPECRRPGDEYLHFRFSQAARDVESAFQFVRSKSATPSKAILVTFSLAAVEGRHAMATSQRPADGWVAVVGVADLQSALRTISGGVDYGYGLLRGVRFGRHELVGVVADMDLTGLDAIQHGIGFLEDARRDMARISAPITWIHGRYDAWMDLDRVAEIMSCGDTSARKLIEVPTGHQLRSSQAALATFRLISEEVSEMALGRRVQGAAPSVSRISNTRDAEMARRPKRSPNVRTFWEDYLLGRDRSLGMQLLTATAQYRNFFESQVRLLGIHDSCRIADLGSGTGEFALGVCGPSVPKGLEVVEVDFVISALRRGARRRERDEKSSATSVRQCAANLDVSRGSFVPLQDGSVDAVLASLIVSYVGSPERLMREAFRILRPGGRFVVSSMLEDADVSMLFHDGLLEYATAEARHGLTDASDDEFDRMVRDFLNDGSRLLDMEEDGTFKFWGEEDLRHAVANAGFARISSALGLGSPPQAVVVRAVKP